MLGKGGRIRTVPMPEPKYTLEPFHVIDRPDSSPSASTTTEIPRAVRASTTNGIPPKDRARFVPTRPKSRNERSPTSTGSSRTIGVNLTVPLGAPPRQERGRHRGADRVCVPRLASGLPLRRHASRRPTRRARPSVAANVTRSLVPPSFKSCSVHRHDGVDTSSK